jgi:hypothetical protein
MSFLNRDQNEKNYKQNNGQNFACFKDSLIKQKL